MVAVFLIGIALGTASAQRLTGKLTGVVTDDQGAPLPGVAVEISSPALMGIQSQITMDKGLYRFINLPPGAYTVSFKLTGFEIVKREAIGISIDSTVTENVVLKPAALQESVTVTGKPRWWTSQPPRQAPCIVSNRLRTSPPAATAFSTSSSRIPDFRRRPGTSDLHPGSPLSDRIQRKIASISMASM